MHGAWSTSLEDQNISSNISFYRKDMGQKLHARSLLVFEMMQVVAFRFVRLFAFVCSFAKESHLFQGLGKSSEWVYAMVSTLYGLLQDQI